MFRLIFRLYGFLRSTEALRHTVFKDFARLLASLQMLSKQMPSVAPPKSGRDGSGASSRQTCSTAAESCLALDGLSLALIKAKGYDLLEEEQRLWPGNIAKATKGGLTFALKLVHPEEREILECLQWPHPHDNHVVELVDVISSDDENDDIIVMPWLSSSLGSLDCTEDVMKSLLTQFLEGVSILHKSHIAHLDLKPGNVLVDRTGPVPHISIIDFGLSTHVENEETTVTSFRGTPSWTAPEVGENHGPIMTYSAIRADRWSCGRMLQHFSKILPIISDASFDHVCAQLLDSDPSRRPSLDMVLEMLQSRTGGKCGVEDPGHVTK